MSYEQVGAPYSTLRFLTMERFASHAQVDVKFLERASRSDNGYDPPAGFHVQVG